MVSIGFYHIITAKYVKVSKDILARERLNGSQRVGQQIVKGSTDLMYSYYIYLFSPVFTF